MGIFVLVIRLGQTSLMALCTKQTVQAGFANLITLVAIAVQREAHAYRRNSDNIVALLSQWLIIVWVSILQLFLSGAFESIPDVLVGLVPVLATIALVGWAFRTVVNETHTKLVQNDNTATVAGKDAPQRKKMIVRSQNGDDRIMTAEQAKSLYEPAPTHQRAIDLVLAEQGFQAYRPTTHVWAHQITTEDIITRFPKGRFISSAGAPVSVSS